MVNMLTISIVIPVYNEAPVLPLLFAGLEITIFGTIELLMFGIFGEYLGRTYEQVKQRPLYIIANIERSSGVAPSPSHSEPS